MSTRQKAGRLLIAAALCAALSVTSVFAATNKWTSASDGVWSNGANWSLGIAPGELDRAYATNSGATNLTITYLNPSNPVLYNLQLDRVGGGMLVVTQAQDFLTVTQNFSMGTIADSQTTFIQNGGTNMLGSLQNLAGFTLGPFTYSAPIVFATATATYHLVSGNLLMSGSLRGGNICGGIGINGCVGNFIQDAGTCTYSSVNAKQLLIGGYRHSTLYLIYANPGIGTYTLNNGYVAFELEIGGIEGGTGRFIQNGGINNLSATIVDIGFFGNGSYQFNGGTMNANNSGGGINVGGNGGTGVWTQTAGVIGNAASAYFRIVVGNGGTNTTGGTGIGTMNMQGGTNRPYYSAFYIGYSGCGILNQTGGLLDKTYQSTSEDYITAIGFTNGAYGTFNLSGGDFLALNLFLGNAVGAIGEVNQTGGTMSFGTSGAGLVVGRNGVGRFNLGNTNTTGVITNVPAQIPNMTIRQTNGASGTLRGWGVVYLGGTNINNGQIIADGYGTNRTLDLSRFARVSNTIENATSETNGWYAQNHGKLTLPPITVTNGNGTYNWGESPDDTNIDLVNSMSFCFTNVTTGGSITNSLLALDRTDVPALPADVTLAGIWYVQAPATFVFSSLNLTIRYDTERLKDRGKWPLSLFRSTGSGWLAVPGTLDETNRQFTATVTSALAGSTFFALGYVSNTYTWVGGNGTWDDSTTTNWLPTGTPVAGDTVHLTGSGNITIQFASSAFTAAGGVALLDVANTGGGTTTLQIATGDLLTYSNIVLETGGRINQTGGLVSNLLTAAYGTPLKIKNGEYVMSGGTNYSCGHIQLADTAGENGALRISGGVFTTKDNAGDLQSRYGNSTLEVTGNGKLFVPRNATAGQYYTDTTHWSPGSGAHQWTVNAGSLVIGAGRYIAIGAGMTVVVTNRTFAGQTWYLNVQSNAQYRTMYSGTMNYDNWLVGGGGAIFQNGGTSVVVNCVAVGYTNASCKALTTGNVSVVNGTLTVGAIGIGCGSTWATLASKPGFGYMLISNSVLQCGAATNVFDYNGIVVGDVTGSGLLELQGAQLQALTDGSNQLHVGVTGTILGYGTNAATTASAFGNNGRVIADGYGQDRTLDLSGYLHPTNGTDNTSDKGWFAQNHGLLLLRGISVGSGTYYWGESGNQDLINSVKLTLTGASGTLSGALLAPDRTDMPAGLYQPLGVWQFSATNPGTGTLTFRYDHTKAAELGVVESHFIVWRYNGGQWTNVVGSLNTTNKTITTKSVTPTGCFAVSTYGDPVDTVYTYNTTNLEVQIRNGALASLKDRSTGKTSILSSDPDYTNVFDRLKCLPSGILKNSGVSGGGFPYKTDLNTFTVNFNATSNLTPLSTSTRIRLNDAWTCQSLSNKGVLVYSDMTNSIRYDVSTDATNDEILVKITGILGTCVAPPVSLDLPIVNIAANKVILGCGVSVDVDKRSWVDSSVYAAQNLYSPPFVVIEQSNSCIAIWHDDPGGLDNVYLCHQQRVSVPRALDHVILHSDYNPEETNTNAIRSSVWRIGVFPDWPAAARRYRQWLKDKTAAKYLWENEVLWLRDIHAIHTGYPMPSSDGANYYANLAAEFAPAKLLLYYQSGNQIALDSDHRYLKNHSSPKDAWVNIFKGLGFRWIAYHPYMLIESPTHISHHLEYLQAMDNLPEGYEFTPDYAGYNGQPATNDFFYYFTPYATNYSIGEQLVLHPGAPEVRGYCVTNVIDFCAYHNLDGAYLDCAGVDRDFLFPLKVYNGRNYHRGETAMFDTFRDTPAGTNLALVSEAQGEWLVPYFSIVHGVAGFFLYTDCVTKINHPLRAALLGSFNWLFSGTTWRDIDQADLALIGALPIAILEDEWRTRVAQFFCNQELYNDFPSQETIALNAPCWGWEDGVKAYYRGKTNQWFQFRQNWEGVSGDCYVKLCSGYATKIVDGNVGIGRFWGYTESPYPNDVIYIPGWPGYNTAGKAIGLNPATNRVYNYIFNELPSAHSNAFWVTSLPEGIYIKDVRHHGVFSTVEFGSLNSGVITGNVDIGYFQSGYAVRDDWNNIYEAPVANTVGTYTLTLPGALVFEWQNTPAINYTNMTQLLSYNGSEFNTGLNERWVIYNSGKFITTNDVFHPPTSVKSNCFTIIVPNPVTNTPAVTALSIGPGFFRGYTGCWVIVPTNAPNLDFLIANPLSGVNYGAIDFTVSVNGKEILRGDCASNDTWYALSAPISLADYAGEKILLTFGVEWKTQRQMTSGADKPGVFGDIKFVSP